MAGPSRTRTLLAFILATVPLLAGCTSDGPDSPATSPTYHFLPGTSVYCIGDAPDGAVCEAGDPAHAFDVEILGSPPAAVRILHESGATAENDTELVLETGRFRRLVDFQTNDRGPPDRTYHIGLGAHVQHLATLLPLSLVFAEDGEYVPGSRDVEGAVRVTLDDDGVEMVTRPPGRFDQQATLVLDAGDGLWPPRRMTLTIENGSDERRDTYYRSSAEPRVIQTLSETPANLIRAPSPRPWESGREALQAVPSLDAFPLPRDFDDVIADASEMSQQVHVWLDAHPAWRMATGSWFNVSFDMWFLRLRDGCDHLEAAVRYQNGTKSVDVAETHRDCSDPLLVPEDGPVAVPDPARLFDLMDHLEITEQPRVLRFSYTAPTEARPGPPTADGARTAYSADWSIHVTTIQVSSGFRWVMEHVLSSDIPDSLSAVQTIRTIGPAP